MWNKEEQKVREGENRKGTCVEEEVGRRKT